MISILIPVYNVEGFILRCLESVANQTYQGDMECIIVDDCGTDNSIDIAQRFIQSYKGPIIFKIIHHNKNRGLAAARNTGVQASSGIFITHLDSDDWLEPQAIELLYKRQTETEADIVSGNALAHYECYDQLLEEPYYSNNMDMVHNTIKMTLDHVIWRRLIRKSLYIDNDICAIEGVNIGEDHHTLPRLAYYAKKVASLSQMIYHYNCMNPNSYMRSASNGINIRRYENDSSSIQILKDFFSDKDESVISELSSISREFETNMRNQAIALGDKRGYEYLCQVQGVTPYYYKLRLKNIYYRILNRFNKLLGK